MKRKATKISSRQYISVYKYDLKHMKMTEILLQLMNKAFISVSSDFFYKETHLFNNFILGSRHLNKNFITFNLMP